MGSARWRSSISLAKHLEHYTYIALWNTCSRRNRRLRSCCARCTERDSDQGVVCTMLDFQTHHADQPASRYHTERVNMLQSVGKRVQRERATYVPCFFFSVTFSITPLFFPGASGNDGVAFGFSFPDQLSKPTRIASTRSRQDSHLSNASWVLCSGGSRNNCNSPSTTCYQANVPVGSICQSWFANDNVVSSSFCILQASLTSNALALANIRHNNIGTPQSSHAKSLSLCCKVISPSLTISGSLNSFPKASSGNKGKVGSVRVTKVSV